jgi:hypothetical protein
MKLFNFLFIMLATQAAFADDSFTIIRDGNEYLCQNNGPRNPVDSVNCANKAYSGPFTHDESIELCSGANSSAPAECGIAAYSGPFTKSEAVALCKFARTISPADCAKKAYSGPFTKSESVEICKGNGTLANADCALKAYAGPYSKDEAVKLCANNPHLALKMLNQLFATSPKMQMNYYNNMKTENPIN